MTQEQFEEFVYEIIPQQLFHVESTDLDDEKGVRLDEMILLDLLHKYPESLKYRRLSWFVKYFIDDYDETKENKFDIKK